MGSKGTWDRENNRPRTLRWEGEGYFPNKTRRSYCSTSGKGRELKRPNLRIRGTEESSVKLQQGISLI